MADYRVFGGDEQVLDDILGMLGAAFGRSNDADGDMHYATEIKNALKNNEDKLRSNKTVAAVDEVRKSTERSKTPTKDTTTTGARKKFDELAERGGITGPCDIFKKTDEPKQPTTKARKLTVDGDGNVIGGAVFSGDNVILAKPNGSNNVDHPSHYNSGKIEVIDFIEDAGLAVGFNLGNAIKYLSRAGLKDGNSAAQDLEKARWYLDRQLSRWSMFRGVAFENKRVENIDIYDYIDDKGFGFNVGRAVSLIYHALHSQNDRLDDLTKAISAINRELKAIKNAEVA